MGDFTRYWIDAQSIQPREAQKPVRQVYVWMQTSDNKIVIVSKDGQTWQLPGGKPEPHESIFDTAIRETHEETGVDIGQYRNKLQMVGYYSVFEPECIPAEYLQVRTVISLPVASHDLELSVNLEDTDQAADDQIRFVEALPLSDVLRRIPWLSETDEFHTVEPRLMVSL